MKTLLKPSLWLVLASTACLFGNSYAQPPGGSPPGGPSDERLGKMLEGQQQKRDDALRKTLKKLGYKDKELQDKIIAYAAERDRARLPLERATTRLAQAVRDKKSSDEQVRTALANMRRAVIDERLRREKARSEREANERKLDAEIGFSKDARLEANLTMLGLIGDETEMLTTAAPGYESEVSASGGERPHGGMEGGGMGGGRRRGGGGFPGGNFPGGW